jgi:MFS transporter, ACS family, glucarate transporter
MGSTTPSVPPARPTAVRWNICALLTIASFVAYLLRTNMSVAGAPMAAELGLTPVQLGVILGGFAWGYAIFQFPGGVIGDRIGARRALAGMAMLWGVLNLLVGLIPAGAALSTTAVLLVLLALRFLMGAAQAPLFPVIGGGTTCNWFPRSGWALPNSLQNAGLTFGSAATGMVIAGLTERYGWRQSFVLTAPLAFLVAAVWWWYGRDHPAEHPRVNRAEQALIDAGRPPAEPPEPGAWKVVLRDRQILLLTLGYFCSNYVFYFFFNWLFIYLVDSRGFRLLEGGVYAAAPWIAGAIGAVLGGWLCDRLWRRLGARLACRILGAAGMAVSAIFLAAAGAAPGPVGAVILLSLCLGAQQFTDPIYWAGTIAVSGRRASAACGVLNTGGNIVGGIGALTVPLTVEWLGWPAALATGSLFGFAAAGVWLFTAVDREIDASATAASSGGREPAGALSALKQSTP